MKERTTLLIAEGEVLKIQNSSFKEELIRLEAEKRRLTEILAEHEHTCDKRQRMNKDKESNKEQENIFKVPDTPMPTSSNLKSSARKVEHFDPERKHPTYNGNTDSCDQEAFSNEFQVYNYGEEFNSNNMFVKQEEEEPSSSECQTQGYLHYSYYGANIRNNFLDNQPLSLSSYGFNTVDNMCVAL